MVREWNEMYIYIHLCVCNNYVDIVKNMINIHLNAIIERENNYILTSMKEFPFLYINATPCKISGWDLKIIIPVKVNCYDILRKQYGYFYHIIKYIYSEKWIAQYIKNKLYTLLYNNFYKSPHVALSSTSIKKIIVSYTPLKN